MNRIRISTIAASLSLTIYFIVAGIAAMFIGPSTTLGMLLAPITLLEDLFSAGLDRSAFACDLLAVFSIWLTFTCLVDLSLIIASIDFRQAIRSITGNNYSKRLLPRLRSI